MAANVNLVFDMRRLYMYFFGLMLMAACHNRNPYANDLGVEPALMAQIDTGNYTTIKWIDSFINVGSLAYGDSVTVHYRFQNTGMKPLFIIEARPSCGCTVAAFPTDPLPAGKTGLITVTVKTGAMVGTLHKPITVVTNTRPKTRSVIYVHALVQAESTWQ